MTLHLDAGGKTQRLLAPCVGRRLRGRQSTDSDLLRLRSREQAESWSGSKSVVSIASDKLLEEEKMHNIKEVNHTN